MGRPYGFHSLPYQTQMSIRRSEGDVARARSRAAANAREAEKATDELETLRARVTELEAENERLSKAVMGGILPDLLNADETDALVDFVKHLRSEAKP